MGRGALTVFTVFLYTCTCITLWFSGNYSFLDAEYSTGKGSDEESIPPLPPPLDNLYPPHNSGYTWNESSNKTTTTMEMELQDLSDRVTILETKCDIVLRQNTEIISRLDALENRSTWQQLSSPHRSFDDLDGLENIHPLESFPSVPEPPPQYLPLHCHKKSTGDTPSRPSQIHCRRSFHSLPLQDIQPYSLPQQNPSPSQLHASQYESTSSHRSRAESASVFTPPTHQPQRFILAANHETRATHQVGSQRNSTQCVAPAVTAPSTSIATNVRTKSSNTYLPSSVINKAKLKESSEVILKYPKLRSPSNVGTLAIKLAREAVFGEEVLAKCTVYGDRELPGLPVEELQQLKQTLLAQYPDYWRSQHEFEPLWKTSTDAIGQLCKRLRNSFKKI